MQANLKVEDFGPIESVTLDLRNVNVFIGPQASGKSALAKIYTICKSPLSFINLAATEATNIENFKKKLDDYNVGSFINESTFIEFESELHYFKFEKGSIVYERKLLKRILYFERLIKDIENNKDKIVDEIFDFSKELFYFDILTLREVFNYEKFITKEDLKNLLYAIKFDIEKLKIIISNLLSVENSLSLTQPLYIPAERNFIPIIKGATLNLLNNNVPIPKHILSFGAEFEKATFTSKEVDLAFIKTGLFYKNEDGEDRIYFAENKSIKLLEAASGIQTVLPLLLPIVSRRENDSFKQSSFVIEEPELNLFPKAQYELIKFIEKGRQNPSNNTMDIGTLHTYTTHSPYILSSFNNLLYASKVFNTICNKELIKHNKNFVDKKFNPYQYVHMMIVSIVPCYIESENFAAYQVSNGSAISILNRETGLIEDNYIDQASDEMGDDFDKLMALMETKTV
jgi:predicted ATPase